MFINIPENLSSLQGELLYKFNNSEVTDILLEVKDCDSDQTLGVKKFYSTSSATINISPLILSNLPKREVTIESNFTSTSTFDREVMLSVGDSDSEARVFTISEQVESVPSVVTTMPRARLLASGEFDNLLILSPKDQELKLKLVLTPLDDYASEVVSNMSVDDNTLANVFTLYADSYNSTYQSAHLYFAVGSTEFAVISYLFTTEAEAADGYRVAWLSERGSIEFYTFPSIREVTHNSDGSVERELRSAYGTREEMEAILGILSSARVWGEADGQFAEVEVATSESSLVKEGALQLFNLRIRENGKDLH